MRKRVQREKPKLEKELLEVVPAWEAQHDKVFLVHGQPLRQIVEESISASEASKENKRVRHISHASSGIADICLQHHKTTAGTQRALPPRSQTPAEPLTSRKRTRTPSANTGNPSTVKRQKLMPSAPATAPAAARAARPLGVATNVYETPGYPAHQQPHTVSKLPAPATARSASANATATGYGKLGYGAPPATATRLPSSNSVFGSTMRIPSATEERIRKAQQRGMGMGRKESFRPRPSVMPGMGLGVSVSVGFAGIKGRGWDVVREEDEEI